MNKTETQNNILDWSQLLGPFRQISFSCLLANRNIARPFPWSRCSDCLWARTGSRTLLQNVEKHKITNNFYCFYYKTYLFLWNAPWKSSMNILDTSDNSFWLHIDMIRKTWYSVDKTTLAKVPCIEKISIYNLNIHEHIAAALSLLQ